MESEVRDVLVTEYLYSLQKCEEMLVLWGKKMAKLDCHFNSSEKHSKFKKFKVATSSKSRMVIGTSEAFINGFECLCCIADPTSRQREMHRSKDYRSKNMLKRVFPVDELENLNQCLKMLEEETKSMKQSILWHLKEERRLINRIYHYFQCIQYMLWQRSEVKGEQFCHKKLIMKPPKDGRAVAGLPEVLCPDFNPSLITKGLQATVYFSRKLQTTPTHIYDSST